MSVSDGRRRRYSDVFNLFHSLYRYGIRHPLKGVCRKKHALFASVPLVASSLMS